MAMTRRPVGALALLSLGNCLLVNVLPVNLVGLSLAPSAVGQTYPDHPVKMIVPYAPGGGTDVFARLLAAHIEHELGQAIVIDNRGGGASVPGTQAVATAAPDGYTIGMVDSAFVTNPGLLRDKLPYDTRKDFVPITLLARTQLVLAVHPSRPYKTVPDLIAFAKANPGKVTFASAGIGTGIHLAGEQLRQVAGIDVAIVSYRGGAPALTDFVAGQVDTAFSAVPSIKEHIEAGKVLGLGVTRGRSAQLPGIPGLDELGLGAVDSASEMGLIAPAALPAAIVDRLQALAAAAVKSPEFAADLLGRGYQPIGSSTEEHRQFVAREVEKWVRIIAASGVKPE